MYQLHQTETLVPKIAWPGVTVRLVHGERLTMVIAELEPGTIVPRHVHENEQVGTVICGSARFTTDTETQELRPGGIYRLLSRVPHKVECGPHGAVFVECFSPVRADWARLVTVPEAVLRWPGAGDEDLLEPAMSKKTC